MVSQLREPRVGNSQYSSSNDPVSLCKIISGMSIGTVACGCHSEVGNEHGTFSSKYTGPDLAINDPARIPVGIASDFAADISGCL